MKIDKKNGNVNYCDETHTYWKDGTDEKYISVTTLIGKFEQPFLRDFWASYKALERLLGKEKFKLEKSKLLKTKRFDNSILATYDITELEFNKTVQDILDEWDKKNRESCERGTKIHAQLEAYAKGGKFKEKIVPNLGRDFNDYKCYVNPDTNELVKSIDKGILPEYLVYRESDDGILKIAGQIDLLIKDGNDIWVADYKGLPLDTEIPTLTGWSIIADLKEGDVIFDKDGNPTKIIHKSKVHTNPCYKITFDNGDSIIADHEHRWEISFRKKYISKKDSDKYSHTVMTTEELAVYLNKINNEGNKNCYTIPKILNPKPLNLPKAKLPLDPYILGVWLGDGSKACGVITQARNSPLWDIIREKGFELSENLIHDPEREGTEMRTVYGLRTILSYLNLIGNKHIPDIYQRASYEQRLQLLRGLMDTDGYYHPSRKRYVMSTGQEWQKDDMVKLVSSLGIKVTVFEVIKKCDGKKFKAWDVCFSTSEFNPFYMRNQEIDLNSAKIDKRTFRNIDKVEKVETVPTQCLEVDSPTHTFLCTKKMIVTHNTNQKIDLKSGFDTTTKKSAKMKYPLNNLDDCNYVHYTLQLSTYAWMLQKINPKYNVKGLILIHFDHEGNITTYQLDYLKDDVERMLAYYKTMRKKEIAQEKRKRIEF